MCAIINFSTAVIEKFETKNFGTEMSKVYNMIVEILNILIQSS